MARQGPIIKYFLMLVQLSLAIRHWGSSYSVQFTKRKLCLDKEKALDAVLLPCSTARAEISGYMVSVLQEIRVKPL